MGVSKSWGSLLGGPSILRTVSFSKSIYTENLFLQTPKPLGHEGWKDAS